MTLATKKVPITQHATPQIIGTLTVKADIYYREASHPHATIVREAGWYYFLDVTMPGTGERLSGQIKGPFETEDAARAHAVAYSGIS